MKNEIRNILFFFIELVAHTVSTQKEGPGFDSQVGLRSFLCLSPSDLLLSKDQYHACLDQSETKFMVEVQSRRDNESMDVQYVTFKVNLLLVGSCTLHLHFTTFAIHSISKRQFFN